MSTWTGRDGKIVPNTVNGVLAYSLKGPLHFLADSKACELSRELIEFSLQMGRVGGVSHILRGDLRVQPIPPYIGLVDSCLGDVFGLLPDSSEDGSYGVDLAGKSLVVVLVESRSESSRSTLIPFHGGGKEVEHLVVQLDDESSHVRRIGNLDAFLN